MRQYSHLFSDSQEANIVRQYADGETSTGLARRLGCNDETIRKIILRNGGVIRPKRKLNDAVAARLVTQYEAGQNTSEIAAEMNLDRHTIRNYILYAGRKLRGPREVHRRRQLDVRCFRKVNEETLYWIGFLLADGNVLENGTLTLGLQGSDRTHIERFKAFLKSDALIKEKLGNRSSFKPGSSAVYLSVMSRDLVEDLAQWGIVPRKSLHEKLLRRPSSRHVWRGIIDGDGTVRIHKRGYLEVKLYGSKVLCGQFRDFVVHLVPDCCAQVCEAGPIYALSLCCGPAEVVARELYRDCNVCLPRKFDVVARWFGWV